MSTLAKDIEHGKGLVAPLAAPFPYFGGKAAIASKVWQRLGDVPNYVEPFFGSGAVLLSRPHNPDVETINDINGLVANFWRAIKADPEEVAYWADNPVNENDLHARHVWLIEQKESLRAFLEGDPDWHDPKIAGWWCWGICCWIGSGFCESGGPWWVDERRKLVDLGNKGQGVNRKLVHLGNKGRGVNRKLVHLGDKGRAIMGWFSELAERLRHVRVCCGDWSRVCGDAPTVKQGVTGVFLDPPYAFEADNQKRRDSLYGEHDCDKVAAQVRQWAIDHGNNPKLRIVLCGYEGEHEMPAGWEYVRWKANGGYGSQGSQGSQNAKRERLWCSPHCLRESSMLFDKHVCG